ncbi:hypothetical protein JHN52_35065 [Streptomyces sp. MBT97]|uniref:hypothetical protein n=1 Tax=Streptomyces sp. MBT97 TaxID=2800411 RepID=UPI00190E0BAF|nr:hypothetical protein [Streptomyces sp. MBT97]MBK3638015.1 hypothetical protein [Streptomyces sp. MBT97]
MGLNAGLQDRTPQELVTELRGLTHVDWPTVWSGPPYPGQGLDMWCAQFDWVPTSFERVLVVRTDTGGTFTLNNLAGSWAPVTHVSHWVWGASAEAVDDNPAVLAEAARAWPLYLTAACSVLGEPTWEGAWEAEDFPENLGSHDAGSREYRLAHQNPHRLAYWTPGDTTGPLVVLEVLLKAGTASPTPRRGAANLSVKFYPRPVEIGEL